MRSEILRADVGRGSCQVCGDYETLDWTGGKEMSEDDSMPPVEDPAYASMCEERTEWQPRLHVSDAAAKAWLGEWGVDLRDHPVMKDYAGIGVILVTTREWDERGRLADTNADYWRDRAEEAEAKLKLASIGHGRGRAVGDVSVALERAVDAIPENNPPAINLMATDIIRSLKSRANELINSGMYSIKTMTKPSPNQSAAPHNKSASLLKMTEPTHKLGGDRSR
jgi:hypothetical protein